VTSVVRGPKMFLIGDEDELGRMGRSKRLRVEPTSADEIKGLIGVVERSLKDDSVEAISCTASRC
jgi:hypothetical protein